MKSSVTALPENPDRPHFVTIAELSPLRGKRRLNADVNGPADFRLKIGRIECRAKFRSSSMR
jgi:hypothetical protein